MDKYEMYKRMLDFTSNATIKITQEEYFYSTYLVTYDQSTYKFCIARKKGIYTGELPVYIFPKRFKSFAIKVCWKKIIEPTLIQLE